MSLPTFTGTTSTILWRNENINIVSNGKPPEPFGWPYKTGDSTTIKTYDPSNSIIKWSGPVPSSLNGITFDQIFDLQVGLNFNLEVNFIFKITSGNQETQCNGQPKLNFNIFSKGGGTQFIATDIASLQPVQNGTPPMSYPFNGQFPTYIFSPGFKTDVTTGIVYDIQAIPWNDNFDCFNYGATNMVIQVDMNLSLSISCQTGLELESDFCLNYCRDEVNQQFCEPQYIDYCLTDTGNGVENINIFSSQACQNFFSNFLSNIGPREEIDSLLTASCSEKFKDVDSYDAGNSVSRTICACHLNEQIYINLQDSLLKEFPGFQYVDVNRRCLFPTCPASVYKTVDIGKVCALPQCIDLASVNNNGTIKGNINIGQDPRCVNASNARSGGDGGSFPKETISWVEKHWVWLVLGIGILVVLIIVILIVLAGESNKKKPKIKLEEI